MPIKIMMVALIFIIPILPTIWAIFDIPKRRFSEPKKRLIWLGVVSTLPCIGAILYIAFGRKHTEPLSADPAS